MPHKIKGQRPGMYLPSATRRASGLSPVNEGSSPARRRWAKLRQAIKKNSALKRNIKAKGYARRGRFNVRLSSPPKKKSPPKNFAVSAWKNTAPGIYFVSSPYKRGRFTVENIHGFVPLRQANVLKTSILRR